MSELPIIQKAPSKYQFSSVFMYVEEFLQESIWVCYRKDGKKIINPDNEREAFSDDPNTWGSFSAACDYIDGHDDYTLGLELGKSEHFSAVHISNCVNPDKTITDKQRINELIRYCSTYKEYDLSGTGITVLLANNDILPYEEYAKSIGDIEIRLFDHYYCIPITGDPYIEETKLKDADYDLNVDPYFMMRCPDFINKIYKWFSGNFSGIEKPKPDNNIPSEIMEIKGLGEYAKHQLNDLVKKNKYFHYLWYNNPPTEKAERRHDIDLVARIYSVVSYDPREVNEIFKASPSFKAKSKDAQSKFKDEKAILKVNPVLAAMARSTAKKAVNINEIETTKVVNINSAEMDNLIGLAKKLNKDKDFMKYDNDIELMRDPIYEDIIDLSNDKACADIFRKAYGNRIKYCAGDGLWYVFNGSYWMSESSSALPHIRSYSEKLFERLGVVLNWYSMELKEKRQLQKNINKFANVMPFKRILESARSKSIIGSDSFNLKTYKLSVGNGTVNLKTGKLEKPDPKDYFTLHTDVYYYPHYCRPRRFIKFLNEIFEGDSELIAYFQRAMGYCITGDTSAQVFFVFHGDGANGKSTLVNILNEVLKDYAGQFDSYALAEKNDGSGKANPVVIDNQSKRYVIVSEKNEGTRLDVALVKAISGGDNISARRLFENNIIIKPTYKLIFVTNFLPNINWDDDGIKRRYRIVPFNAKFKGDNADPRIADKILAKEKEMILKWLVDGAKEYYKNQYSLGETPKSMEKAMNEARYEQDVLYAYKEDCLEVTPDEESNKIQSRPLYLDYVRWCKEKGYKTVTETDFGNKMPGILGVVKNKKTNVYYFGVRFKNQASDTEEEHKDSEGQRVSRKSEQN